MTINELATALSEQIARGNGELEVVVGFDDAPEYVSSIDLGGIAVVRTEYVGEGAVPGPHTVETGDEAALWAEPKSVLSLWYSQHSANYYMHDGDNAV